MDSSQKRDQAIEGLLRRPLEMPKPAAATDPCLDAETVAAMMDGGLPATALNAAQMHLAHCARCQRLVGALARADSAASLPPSVPPVTAHAHAVGWWLARVVPLTAAAAAIVLWVAVFPRDTARLPETTEARRQAPAPAGEQPPIPVDRPRAIAKPDSSPQRQRAPSAAEIATKDKEGPASELRRETDRSAADRLDTQSPASAAADSSASAKSAPAVAEAPSERSENVLNSARSVARSAQIAGVEIISPAPMVRWRIAGPTIQRSTDGGANWEVQSTGNAAELTAGIAPSPAVCWVVGRGGVVLLSIDGRTWRRLAFPEITDLSAVRARDARRASVSTADGRTFSTTDAGTTWVPGPLQDF